MHSLVHCTRSRVKVKCGTRNRNETVMINMFLNCTMKKSKRLYVLALSVQTSIDTNSSVFIMNYLSWKKLVLFGLNISVGTNGQISVKLSSKVNQHYLFRLRKGSSMVNGNILQNRLFVDTVFVAIKGCHFIMTFCNKITLNLLVLQNIWKNMTARFLLWLLGVRAIARTPPPKFILVEYFRYCQNII